MDNKITESTLESAALDWLASLGHEVKHGPAIASGEPAPERSSYAAVVLARRLRKSLTERAPATGRRKKHCGAPVEPIESPVLRGRVRSDAGPALRAVSSVGRAADF